jgi:GTP-binding protein
MQFKSARYVGSYAKLSDSPQDTLPQFAFIGRSNVGKSSLINYLCNNKTLAKTSGTPGKTQTLNFFMIEEKFYLVDLPGYGYARVGKQLRAGFSKLIAYYLKNSKDLLCVYTLIDMSIPPQKLDIEMLQFLSSHEIPFQIVFTKADRLTQAKRHLAIKAYWEKLKENWSAMPNHFVCSAHDKYGSDSILENIRTILTL